MTTTAYDTHFIASDIAFTDENDVVHLNINFRKVKRIGNAVIGMAGCFRCMIEFTDMVLSYVLQKIPEFEIPSSILNRLDKDFVVIVHMDGMCLKATKPKFVNTIQIENITQVPTVIGSGSQYVKDVLDDCPNAVVAVLEAIKHDKYTCGDVKYCSIRREDVHNLEIDPMSIQLKTQLAGLQNEVTAANDFLNRDENQGKAFRASTEALHLGTPSPMPTELGMLLLKQGFSAIRNNLAENKG